MRDASWATRPGFGTAPPPGAFLDEPSDPTDSRAAAIEFQAASTTLLFRLRFQASPTAPDGQADDAEAGA